MAAPEAQIGTQEKEVPNKVQLGHSFRQERLWRPPPYSWKNKANKLPQLLPARKLPSGDSRGLATPYESKLWGTRDDRGGNDLRTTYSSAPTG